MKINIKIIILITTLSFRLYLPGICAVRLEGLSEYENFPPSTNQQGFLIQERFSAFVDGAKWLVTTDLIKITPNLPPQLFCPLHQVIGSDGRDTYSLKRMPQNNGTIEFGSVEPGSSPNLFESPPSVALWLAYCAGTLLADDGPSTLTPVWGGPTTKKRSENCEMVVTFVRNLSKRDYLNKLIYRCDGRLDPCNPSEDKSNVMASPWRNGFDQGVFHVDTTSNVSANIEMPSTFAFDSFNPTPKGLRKISSIRIRVTNIQMDVDIASWLPPLPQKSVPISDFRFTAQVTNWSAVNYKITNVWRQRSDELVLASVQMAEKTKPMPSPHDVRKSRLIRILFITFLSVPLALILFFLIQRKNNIKNT